MIIIGVPDQKRPVPSVGARGASFGEDMTEKDTTSSTSRRGLFRGIAAVAAAGALCAVPGAAYATVDADSLVDNITTAGAAFTTLISLVGYVGGSGLGVFGIYKLKQHVDAPATVFLREGLIRLAAGGALLSLPFIISTMQGSIMEDAGGAQAEQASIVQFATATANNGQGQVLNAAQGTAGGQGQFTGTQQGIVPGG